MTSDAMDEMNTDYISKTVASEVGIKSSQVRSQEQTTSTHEPPISKAILSLILDNVQDIVFLLEVEPDGNYSFLFINPPFLAATGLPEDRVIGKRVQEVIPEPAHPLVLGKYAEAIRSRSFVNWQETSVYPSGERIGEVRVIPIFNHQGRCTHLLGTVHDITQRKQAEKILRTSEHQFRQMADAIPSIIWTTHSDGNLDYLNQRWYDYTGFQPGPINPAEWAAAIHGEDLERVSAAWFAAQIEGMAWETEYRLRQTDGHYRWHLGRSVPVRAGDAIIRWVGTATDIEDRKQAEEALRRSQEDLCMAIEGAQIGTFYCDWPLDKIVWNDTCKEHFFIPHDTEVNFDLFYSLLHPDDREPTRIAIERAMAERVAYDVEYRTLGSGGRTRWINAVGRFYYGPDGTPIRFDGITLDISARKDAEKALLARAEHEALLNQISQAVLHTSGPREIQTVTVTTLGKAMGVDRCYVHFFDSHQDATWIETDWYRKGLTSVAGRYPLSQMQPILLNDLFRYGESVRIDDVRQSFLQPETVNVLDQGGYRAILTTPFYSQDRLTALLALVMADAPRAWSDDEVLLLEAVAAQTRSAVEAARMLDAQQARLNQEALIGRIGVAIRTTLSPDAVLEVAVRELGQALRADRSYYAAYNQETDRATLGPEWYREDLSPISGEYIMSQFAVNRDPEYKAGRTQVLTDTGDDLATQELGIRALVRVPLVSGTAMTALSVAMADGPRVWTRDEVALVETVATQTQTALESVRVRRREHALAEQLAQALQPVTPSVIPGMELAQYYRPALEDQGVGGDFSDVFSTDKGVTFLIVGDLSGKGLAAATQVAMVRNMLRFALYNGRSVAGPVGSLNSTLTENDLLSGFSTLFVGRYDAEARSLTYVNCGQDAGLILRAVTGEIETMPPTGAILGASSGAIFSEETVILELGDVLALYTDGLTEAGPSRMALLTGDGVATLLQEQRHERSAQAIVARLIAGVDAFAQSGVRDDQCLLVGIVNG